VDFDPASSEDVMAAITKTVKEDIDGGIKTASAIYAKPDVSRLEEILGIDSTEKTASEDPFLITPDDESSWERISAKLGQARAVVQDQLSGAESRAIEISAEIVKTASSMRVDGLSIGQISDAIQRSTGGENSSAALITMLEKSAFNRHPDSSSAFDMFEAAAAQNDGCTRGFFEKAALEPGKIDTDESTLNPDHPLVKQSSDFHALCEEAEVLTLAIQDLDQQIAGADRLAMVGAEVPVHV
jgi:hypothetical protein